MMKAEITKDVVNPILKRGEINFSLTFEGPQPSRIDTKKILTAAFDLTPELLVIERMQTVFGKQEVVGYAKVYDDSASMQMIEQSHILARNTVKTEEEA